MPVGSRRETGNCGADSSAVDIAAVDIAAADAAVAGIADPDIVAGIADPDIAAGIAEADIAAADTVVGTVVGIFVGIVGIGLGVVEGHIVEGIAGLDLVLADRHQTFVQSLELEVELLVQAVAAVVQQWIARQVEVQCLLER